VKSRKRERDALALADQLHSAAIHLLRHLRAARAIQKDHWMFIDSLRKRGELRANPGEV